MKPSLSILSLAIVSGLAAGQMARAEDPVPAASPAAAAEAKVEKKETAKKKDKKKKAAAMDGCGGKDGCPGKMMEKKGDEKPTDAHKH